MDHNLETLQTVNTTHLFKQEATAPPRHLSRLKWDHPTYIYNYVIARQSPLYLDT